MPLFDYRTEAQDDSGHFRQGTQEGENKAHAKTLIEAREFRYALYRMSDEQVQSFLDANDAKSLDDLPPPAPRDASEAAKDEHRSINVPDGLRRAHLNLHRQQEPYKLVSLKPSRKQG